MSEALRPATAEDVRDLVAWALAEEYALEVLGAGTKRGFGRPVHAAHVVRLDRLREISLYEPEELVMSAAVGTPLAEITARLAENRQELAFEPPDWGPLFGQPAGQGTIGGVFACNLSGPRRIKAGAARDHFLGVQAVTGRGDLIKSGGRVMKNVTGYDLCKLLCGSHGSLAVMTEVTFKVLPAAETTLTLLLGGLDRAASLQALRTATGTAYDVAAAAYLPATVGQRSSLPEIAAAGHGLALIRLEGPAPSVRYRADSLIKLLGPLGGEIAELDSEPSAVLWREIRDLRLLGLGDAVIWRVSVPPASGASIIAELKPELAFDWQADWAGGLLWLAVRNVTDGGAAAIRAAVAHSGGHATLIRGSEALRASIDVFQPQPPPLAALTARVKESFDPKCILNPGRMYPAA